MVHIYKCKRDGCQKSFYVKPCRLGIAKFCSRHCLALHRKMVQFGIRQVLPERKKIIWSRNLGYLIGLITSDGTLRKNRKTIKIGMKDKEAIEFARSVILEEVIGRAYEIYIDKKKVGGVTYQLYTYQFTSPVFYDFCLDIGLIPNKSLTLKELRIPKEFFSSFLLGVIDGDGNYNKLDRKLKGGKMVEHNHIRIFSGSEEFLIWLNDQVSENYGVERGKIVRDDKYRKNPKFTLFWSNKRDVNKILQKIYLLEPFSLIRKKDIVKKCLE